MLKRENQRERETHIDPTKETWIPAKAEDFLQRSIIVQEEWRIPPNCNENYSTEG